MVPLKVGLRAAAGSHRIGRKDGCDEHADGSDTQHGEADVTDNCADL
jgi:hypothetical protein